MWTSVIDADGKYYPIQSDGLNSASSSILLTENGTLSITGINKKHEGMYQCTVSNEVGTPLKKSANLRVIGKRKRI